MKIDLTKEQYVALAKAVYLGNWVANAHRCGHDHDPTLPEYDAIAEYVYSLAPQFGLPKNIEHELEFGDLGYATELARLREEYDEEVFWSELCDRLGERDFVRRYTSEERMQMDEDEHFERLNACVSALEDETEAHGLERLEFMKTLEDLGL